MLRVRWVMCVVCAWLHHFTNNFFIVITPFLAIISLQNLHMPWQHSINNIFVHSAEHYINFRNLFDNKSWYITHHCLCAKLWYLQCLYEHWAIDVSPCSFILQWFLDTMAVDDWWPQQILIKCPNQVVRQVCAQKQIGHVALVAITRTITLYPII